MVVMHVSTVPYSPFAVAVISHVLSTNLKGEKRYCGVENSKRHSQVAAEKFVGCLENIRMCMCINKKCKLKREKRPSHLDVFGFNFQKHTI